MSSFLHKKILKYITLRYILIHKSTDITHFYAILFLNFHLHIFIIYFGFWVDLYSVYCYNVFKFEILKLYTLGYRIRKRREREIKLQVVKLKEEKGITILVLATTIIILLILAGISIAILSGDNGIIKKSRKSKRRNRN